MDYNSALDNVYKNLPESILKKERFELQEVKSMIQGNKTIISNFGSIISQIRREPEHLLKFLLRELATPGSIDGPRLVLGRKISSKLIQQKVDEYVKIFVLCHDCKKPDTKLIKEDKILSIKCMACGAKHPIKSKI